ncbi:MAG: hypothetical protein A2X45_11375 [Lentisphaerae bacterium GWF2_50_93]|nr:MAG: hypothetical protein A2X45_11375 [Lentisphaerae bacterium GWF2_50_93]
MKKIILNMMCCVFFGGTAMAGVDLVKDGKTDYVIAVDGKAEPAEKNAALELSEFLQQITGVRFKIVNELQASKSIVVGKAFAESKGVAASLPQLGDDGFVIKTVDGNLIITGAGPRGTLYGAYAFLGKYLGCRWYSWDCSMIPSRKDISLPDINDLEIPRFKYREVFNKEGEDADFCARNMLNGQLGHRSTKSTLLAKHGWGMCNYGTDVLSLVNPKVYQKKHPEYFGGGQLQFMNEQARKIATLSVDDILSTKPKRACIFGIAHMDIGSFYNGGADGEFNKAGGSSGAALMDFTREIAEKLAKDYPDVVFTGEAYLWSRKPCSNVKFPPNMGVCFAPIESDFSLPFSAPANKNIVEELDGWCKITDHVRVWTYITNFGHYVQPHPNLYAMCEDIKLLAARPQVDQVFCQGAYHSLGGEFAALRAWVLARLMWNPALKADDLIREFADGYYGPGAPMVMKYIEILHKSMEDNHSKLACKTAPTEPYLNAKMLIEADALFQEAEKACVGKPEYLKHVQIARIPVDYIMLLNQANLRKQAEDAKLTWPEDKGRYARFAQYADIAKLTSVGESSGSLAVMLEALKVERKIAAPPRECEGLARNEWVEVQDISFKLCGANIVPDSKASDGGAAMMKGNSATWGIQASLQNIIPEGDGQWDLYAVGRIDKGNGAADATAFNLGVYPPFADTMKVKVGEVEDGEYHTFKLSKSPYVYDAGKAFWAAPPNSDAIKAFYIDRVFAVRRK